MTRRLAALALALLLAACGRAAEPLAAPGEARPALWELRDAAGHTGWLFGTIHALPDRTAWLTPRLEAALDGAGVLVVEIADLGDRTAAGRAFAAVASTPGLPPLLSRVAPADRAALAAALERGGLTESQFAGTESWAAALILANAVRSGESGNGVDRALLRRGLPVEGLESFAGQYAIFDRLAEPDQAELLRRAARDGTPDKERAEARAWLTGDLAELERQADDSLLADPELRRALLVERNAAWVPRIAALVRAGRRPLVAVGAGHMLGPDGLPARLAGQGLAVTRIQ